MNENPRIAQIARWHVAFGLSFGVIGMGLGIYMAMSENHAERPAHAHILLLGLVVSVLYGVVYKLWLPGASSGMATAQTALHQIGTVILAGGLFVLFGGWATEATLAPVLGLGSICALLGAVLMLWQFLRVRVSLPTPKAGVMAAGKL